MLRSSFAPATEQTSKMLFSAPATVTQIGSGSKADVSPLFITEIKTCLALNPAIFAHVRPLTLISFLGFPQIPPQFPRLPWWRHR